MNKAVELRNETIISEVNYIKEIHADMAEKDKTFYTSSYDFANQDRVKITIERVVNRTDF